MRGSLPHVLFALGLMTGFGRPLSASTLPAVYEYVDAAGRTHAYRWAMQARPVAGSEELSFVAYASSLTDGAPLGMQTGTLRDGGRTLEQIVSKSFVRKRGVFSSFYEELFRQYPGLEHIEIKTNLAADNLATVQEGGLRMLPQHRILSGRWRWLGWVKSSTVWENGADVEVHWFKPRSNIFRELIATMARLNKYGGEFLPAYNQADRTFLTLAETVGPFVRGMKWGGKLLNRIAVPLAAVSFAFQMVRVKEITEETNRNHGPVAAGALGAAATLTTAERILLPFHDAIKLVAPPMPDRLEGPFEPAPKPQQPSASRH